MMACLYFCLHAWKATINRTVEENSLKLAVSDNCMLWMQLQLCCIYMHVCAHDVFCTVQFLDDDDCTGFIEIIDYTCA